MPHCRLKDVEGAINQYLDCLAGSFRAPGNAQGRLMKYVVDAFRGSIHQLAITYIAFDDLYAHLFSGPSQIVQFPRTKLSITRLQPHRPAPVDPRLCFQQIQRRL